MLLMDDGWFDMHAIMGAASEATGRDETHFSCCTLGICMQKMQYATSLPNRQTSTSEMSHICEL